MKSEFLGWCQASVVFQISRWFQRAEKFGSLWALRMNLCSSVSQSVVLQPTASASPGNLLKVQILWPHLTHPKSETEDKAQQLYFSKIFGLMCTQFWESFFKKRAFGDVLKKLFRSGPASFLSLWHVEWMWKSMCPLDVEDDMNVSVQPIVKNSQRARGRVGLFPLVPHAHTGRAFFQRVRQTDRFCFLFLYQRWLYCPSKGEEM